MRSEWLLEQVWNQQVMLSASQQTLLGRRVLHQGTRTRVVLQTRRTRLVSSRRLHHRRGEERSHVQQAHSEAVLRRSRLRDPASTGQVCLHQARRVWILHLRHVHQQRHQYQRGVHETRQQDSGVLYGRLQHQHCRTRSLQKTWRTWVLLVQRVHHCRRSQRPVQQARRWQQESVQGGRLHHSCSSTWRLWQTWRKWNVQVCRMFQQCSIWISALRQTRQRKEEAVLRGGLHHQL